MIITVGLVGLTVQGIVLTTLPAEGGKQQEQDLNLTQDLNLQH
ncbi:MAG: hypothetical protein WBZ36_03155 [Candidatus Nitrosopolaris sp.]